MSVFDSSTHLRELPLVSLDLETVGLAPSLDPVLEVAAVFFRKSGRVTDTFQSLANPGIAIPKRIVALTHITDEMVQDSRPSPEVMADTFDRLGDGPLILIAHGVSTDIAFLAENARQLGRKLPQMIAVDTLPMARKFLKNSPDYRLETLTKQFLEPQPNDAFHRALADATYTKDLFLKCLEVSQGSLSCIADLEKIQAIVSLPDPDRPLPKFPEKYRDLLTWTREERPMEIVYRGGSHKGTRRPITPETLFHRTGHHYLRAWCHLDTISKDFRLDRIGSYRLMEKESQASPEQDSD